MKLFRHSKWPRRMIQLHYITIGSFVLLLFSGIALFWQPVHTILIPVLPILYDVHIVLGFTFAITLLIPLITLFPIGKMIRRLDWLIPTLFGISVVITGILLWQTVRVPSIMVSRAFAWHGDLSYLLALWVVLHGIFKAVGYRPKRWNQRIDPSRRQFSQWLLSGVLFTAVVIILDPYEILRQLWSNSKQIGSTPPATPGDFIEFYTVTQGFPVIAANTYRLTIDGLVTKPLSLTLSEIKALPTRKENTDFHCVTGWSVANVTWDGLSIKALATLVQPLSQAKYVHFYSADGVYTESLSLAEAYDPTVLLAYGMQGQPLLTRQGYPIRLVVPKMYGYKSIKWVNRVTFSDQPLVGYWEQRGYPNEAFLGSSF